MVASGERVIIAAKAGNKYHFSMTTASRKRADTQVTPSQILGRLSARRRQLISRVFEHPREYVLLSVRTLAQKLGADPMTTLRTIRGMGFESYSQFQRYLHELSITYATPLDLMTMHVGSRSTLGRQMRESLLTDMRSLEALKNTIDMNRAEKLVKRICESQRIALLGGDLAANLTRFLHYLFTVLGFDAAAPITPGEVEHTVRSLGRGDLVIAIGFHQGLLQTVEGLQEARRGGAYCIGITDTQVSPIARFADEFFPVSTEGVSFGDSYVAPMALLNMLLVGCSSYRRPRTVRILKEVHKKRFKGFRWYRER